MLFYLSYYVKMMVKLNKKKVKGYLFKFYMFFFIKMMFNCFENDYVYFYFLYNLLLG